MIPNIPQLDEELSIEYLINPPVVTSIKKKRPRYIAVINGRPVVDGKGNIVIQASKDFTYKIANLIFDSYSKQHLVKHPYRNDNGNYHQWSDARVNVWDQSNRIARELIDQGRVVIEEIQQNT